MIIPVQYMRDGRTRLRSFERNLSKEITRHEGMGRELPDNLFDRYKSDYYNLSLELLNAIEEIRNALQDTSVTMKAIRRAESVKEEILQTNEQLQDYEPNQFIRALQRVEQSYQADDAFVDFSQQYYKNSFRNTVGYSSTRDLEGATLNNMIGAIQADRPFTFLDAAGRNGTNLKSFETEGLEYESYALNVRETQHYSFKESGYDRIALGTLKGGTFSNEAFDIMFLNPPLSLDTQSDRLMEKTERNMIRDTFKLLRPGGVLFLALPAFRFYKDICVLISKGYRDLQIRKSGGFDDTKMLYITAIRRTKEEAKEVDESTYRLLRTISTNHDIRDVYDEPYQPIALPEGEMTVQTFRGSILNRDEVSTIFEQSSCMDQFFRAQQYRDVTQETREPLLPFTTGQLGLVLTSGSLDGIIDEGNGHSHVVKGRVVKSKAVEQNEDRENNEVTYTETIANRVEINVITADGTLKQLA